MTFAERRIVFAYSAQLYKLLCLLRVFCPSPCVTAQVICRLSVWHILLSFFPLSTSLPPPTISIQHEDHITITNTAHSITE